MKIGIIGSGEVGGTLARYWVDAGHEVILSSRHPEQLKPLARELGLRAMAGSAHQAALAGQVILLAVPLKALVEFSESVRAAMRGKVVMNACNAFEERDGDAAIAALQSRQGVALWSTRLFPGARMVRAFNTIPAKEYPNFVHKKEQRIGVPVAGEEQGAIDVVSMLARDIGLEPIAVGDLLQARKFEPGTPFFGRAIEANRLRQMLGIREAEAA